MELKDFNILRMRPWTRPGASAVRGGSGHGDRRWATLHHADPCSRLLLKNEQLLTFHLQIRVASRKALAYRTRRLARLALESTGFEPAGSDPPKPSLARPMRHQTVCPLSCQTT